jgi:hypothetical protein
MPSTTSRRCIELPVDIYAALTQVADERHLPTAALASVWLYDRLQQERPDIRLNPNTYRYRAMHDRRVDAKVYTWGPPVPRMPYFNALDDREEVTTDDG